MKFKVDSEACQSATSCIAFQLNKQDIYELNDDNKAQIITIDGDKVQDEWVDVKDLEGYSDEHKKEAKKTVVDSAKACSFNAIVVKDDKGKQIWPEG